jgi:hypothetical protein
MSSSESEHENLKRFAESVDVTMFSNKLYSKTDHEEKEEPKVELKSQRELETEENIFQSEVNVSSSMQTVSKCRSIVINILICQKFF